MTWKLETCNNLNDYLYRLDYFEGYKSKTTSLLYQGLVMDLKYFYKRIVFIYIRESPSLSEIKELKNSIKNSDCIMGDLNLNPQIQDQKKKLLMLSGKTKFLSLEENTTSHDSQLDHIILENDLRKHSYSTAYFSFASDHKAIALRLASVSNEFTHEFRKNQNFDAERHLKAKKRTNIKNECEQLHCVADVNFCIPRECCNQFCVFQTWSRIIRFVLIR